MKFVFWLFCVFYSFIVLFRDHFYQYGEIRSITLLTKQQCAFIQFTTRTAAELAAEKAFNKLILCGRRLTIKWGRSQAKISSSGVKESETKNLEPVPGLPDGKYFFFLNVLNISAYVDN